MEGDKRPRDKTGEEEKEEEGSARVRVEAKETEAAMSSEANESGAHAK